MNMVDDGFSDSDAEEEEEDDDRARVVKSDCCWNNLLLQNFCIAQIAKEG